MVAVFARLHDVIVNLKDLMHEATALLWRHGLQLPLRNLDSSIRRQGRELVVVLLEQYLKAFHGVVCLVQVKLVWSVFAGFVEFLEQFFSHLQVWIYVARHTPFWETLIVFFSICAACSPRKLIGSNWRGRRSCRPRISGFAALTRCCRCARLLLASRSGLSVLSGSLTTFSSLLFAPRLWLPSLLCLSGLLLSDLALKIRLHPVLYCLLIEQ